MYFSRVGLTPLRPTTRIAFVGFRGVMYMKRLPYFSLWLLLFSLLFTVSAFAQNDEDKDHHHHEDLNETQLGTVHFPVSCAPSVQKPFERGVALLHSFWYEEAEKEFLDIEKDDPNCAMAHWGVAMSIWHQLWNNPDAGVVARANKELNAAENLQTTPREKAYLTAIGMFYANSDKLDHDARAKAYSAAMKKVYENYPDDHEAAVFYALSLLTSEPHDDPTFANRKQAAAILEKLFATEPDHPGVAHYLIHSYDKPQLAQLGIPAARRYAAVAPAAPHALHMPSHIFARVGLWQDDINSNLASVAATRKMSAMGMGGEGHQFHAMNFLFYAYMQSGREAEARALMDEISKMPAMHDMYGLGFDPHLSTEANMVSQFPIEMRDWAAAAALPPVDVAGTGQNSFRYWAKAIGAAHLHQTEEVRKDVRAIEVIHQKFVEDKKKDFAEATENDLKQTQAWLAFSEGKYDDAVRILRPLAEKEESLGDEPQGIPSREMIAEILLEAKRPQKALEEYQTDLKFSPGRFDGLYGAARAAEAAGKQSDADEYYAQLVKTCEGGTSTRPELSHARELLAKK
jgi:tetratricopeptide (TPR) repeat protein